MAARRPTSSTATFAPAAGSFAELGVSEALVSVLAKQSITAPFPIQSATLPDSIAGRDVLGRGRTGSGKTLAFALPIVTRLAQRPATRRPGRPRALVLAPTRELANQIAATIAPLADACSLRTATIFGGVGAGPQAAALRSGVDILVACPGRLLDHLSTGAASLASVEITVLDEADHMADLGFLPAVRRLMDQTPQTGQRMLFSATLDNGVDILVRRYLNQPVTHSVDPPRSHVVAMDHHVLHVTPEDRLPVLVDLTAAPGRSIVFTRTKHGAKKLTRQLVASGVPAVELHGNLSQGARLRSLAAFTDGSVSTLVATDIAARGIHVDDVHLVVHADPPAEDKAYLHRSGRTARAGAAGTVVTLMTTDQMREVQELTRKAGIRPALTRLGPGHPLLRDLAPGERMFTAPPSAASAATAGSSSRGSSGGASSGRRSSRRSSAGAPRSSGGGSRSSGGRSSGAADASRSGEAGASRSSGGGAGSGNVAAFSSRSRIGRR
jgi:superfamily II DNA/RNA helicase